VAGKQASDRPRADDAHPVDHGMRSLIKSCAGVKLGD
jgi:hypothetical protein